MRLIKYSYRHLKLLPIQTSNSLVSLTTAYPLNNMETSVPTVFHSLKSVLDVLKKSEFSNSEGVQKLLAVYNKTCSDYGGLKGTEAKKFPFIVFEGLDATGKSTISRNIAKKYCGSLMRTPPNSVSDLRSHFEQKLLSAPFYSMGNYIAELEILDALQRSPVILDRFWHSTAAFWLSESVQNGFIEKLPPESDKIYSWPCDLLKPDMVIALVTTEEVRRQRISRRKVTTNQEELLKTSVEFRNNIIQAYANMSDPKIEFVESNGTIGQVVNLVDAKIKHLFA